MKRIYFIVISLILIFTFCEKEDELNVKTNKIEFTSFNVTNISYKSAEVSSIIPEDYGVDIDEYGHCWGLDSLTDISDSCTIFTEYSSNAFVSNLSGLKHNSTYYVRSYFKTGKVINYSKEISFKTLEIKVPEVKTKEITNLRAKTTETGGEVLKDNGGVVLSRGVCWNKAGDPTIEDSLSSDTLVVGEYVINLNNLEVGTTYYLRAYATNEVGTGYGDEISFTTKDGIPEISTTEISNLTAISAQTGGAISDDGGLDVISRGVCYNTTGSPKVTDNALNGGSGIGTFQSDLAYLQINTIYYIRAYAINDIDTTYGNEIIFTTKDGIIDIVTKEITEIFSLSAVSGGEILDDEGLDITEKGVCWNTSGNPEITDQKRVEGSGNEEFTSNIENLTLSTTYYLRAYIVNEVGVSYGNQQVFNTNDGGRPIINTVDLSEITLNSLKSGGDIISNEGYEITEKGVCWNTTGSPTSTDFKINEGLGNEDFTSLIDNLTEGESYFIRAYAVNSIGVGYGNELAINLTADNFSVQDYDGNWYNVVKIGNQIWMKENLKTTHYATGEALMDGSIEQDIDLKGDFTSKYWFYNESFSGTNQDYKTTYGLLYTWAAAMNGNESVNSNPSGIQGVCPDGWHIPSYLEIEELVSFLGGSEIAGGKLKEEGYEHWVEPNNGADNESGFTALPSGHRFNNGEYVWLGQDVYFWSTTESGSYVRSLHCATGFDSTPYFDAYKSQSISVRCVKD